MAPEVSVDLAVATEAGIYARIVWGLVRNATRNQAEF